MHRKMYSLGWLCFVIYNKISEIWNLFFLPQVCKGAFTAGIFVLLGAGGRRAKCLLPGPHPGFRLPSTAPRARGGREMLHQQGRCPVPTMPGFGAARFDPPGLKNSSVVPAPSVGTPTPRGELSRSQEEGLRHETNTRATSKPRRDKRDLGLFPH